MKPAMLTGLALIATLSAAHGDPGQTAVPAPLELAPEVWLIPGGIRPDRQPDGNSVVFATPEGLVVVDTGRHEWHRQAIRDLAVARKQPVVAIVNTHWHLDHVSGNPDLRAAYPGLRVHASDAIDGALEGFLAQSARDSTAYLADPQIPATMREDIRADLQTIDNGTALRPDVPIRSSGTLALGGRDFSVHLVRDAVTAGDVWLYDEANQIAVLGDLVTLPAPFLDTACPDGWMAALAEVATAPFERGIPGHGAPMSRDGFERYHRALDAFIDCSRSTASAGDCATRWADAVEPLLVDSTGERPRARRLAEYYVGLLRSNGGRSPHCRAAAGAAR